MTTCMRHGLAKPAMVHILLDVLTCAFWINRVFYVRRIIASVEPDEAREMIDTLGVCTEDLNPRTLDADEARQGEIAP